MNREFLDTFSIGDSSTFSRKGFLIAIRMMMTIPRCLLTIPLLPGVIALFAAVAQAQSFTVRPSRPAAGMTAFVNVNVIPMDTERVLTDQTVLIEGEWITALGPSQQVQIPKSAVRIDGRGKYLIPGLSDCHAHIKGLKPEVDAAQQPVQRQLLRWLAAGITTVRNMNRYGVRRSELGLQLKARAAAGDLLSPHIYTSANISNLTKITPDSVLAEVTRYKQAGYDFIKIRFEGHNLTAFKTLMAAAQQVNLPVVGHYPGANTWDQALASGMQSFEHMTHLPVVLLAGCGNRYECEPINLT